MAGRAKVEEGDAPKKKGKLPLIIMGAVLVLGGGGAGAWYFMGSRHSAEPQEVKVKPPIFAPLESFTVNLLPEGPSQNYLQTTMTLKVSDNDVAEVIKQNMAEVRNRILFLLSSKKASELLTTAENVNCLIKSCARRERWSRPATSSGKPGTRSSRKSASWNEQRGKKPKARSRAAPNRV